MKTPAHAAKEAERVRWMNRALRLAARGEGCTRPNPPVGAVVVRNGKEIGAGYHERAGAPHAEVQALAQAGVGARGSRLFATLEPCSTRGRTGPCTEAILQAGIAEVVVAVLDPNPNHRGRGLTLLRQAGLAVVKGVGAERAQALIAPFETWLRCGRPHVTLKMAMTLDGRIGDRSGRSRWITGARARAQVAQWRRKADALLVGSRTVQLDNPGLRSDGANELWRVIVDSRGRLPLAARVLSDEWREHTLVATTRACPNSVREAYRATGARVEVMPARRGRVSLSALLRLLGDRGWLHVLCEGGGELAAELVREDLVDEHLFFVAPRFLGGGGLPVLGGPGWPFPAAPTLRFVETRRIGEDIMMRARPENRMAPADHWNGCWNGAVS